MSTLFLTATQMYHVGPRLPHVNRDAPINNGNDGSQDLPTLFCDKNLSPYLLCRPPSLLHSSHLHSQGQTVGADAGTLVLGLRQTDTIKHLYSYSLCRHVLYTECYLDKLLLSFLMQPKINYVIKKLERNLGQRLHLHNT